MLPGETIRSGAKPECPECGKKLEFKVCWSAAGCYVGTSCCCGPYTRESHYYGSAYECEYALRSGTVNWRT